ncbi:hypothetical protein TBK1r_07820 [Stieleria magnilauensis]|uniref:Uncharacterized protein n=1 Tax=Stieleria magnilauensis TaxID=2527963 RepID=A0ABX5XKI1_9BACT|nr:hypothetical protein TBK1r_07820 [Planctomycetes bacterium TBK1r]
MTIEPTDSSANPQIVARTHGLERAVIRGFALPSVGIPFEASDDFAHRITHSGVQLTLVGGVLL